MSTWILYLIATCITLPLGVTGLVAYSFVAPFDAIATKNKDNTNPIIKPEKSKLLEYESASYDNSFFKKEDIHKDSSEVNNESWSCN